jgi:inorganic triphosphatase YgiF
MSEQGEPGAISVEIERKYEAGGDIQTPDLAGIGPITVIESPQTFELDAVYYDTESLDLAHARVALRRREGGHDAGWHIKRSAEEGRTEQQWPLDDVATGRVPADVRAELASIVGDDDLIAVARVRNRRVVARLLDAAGHPIAELCDDHVTGENLVAGRSRRWREWEVELLAGAPETAVERGRLLDDIEEAVLAAGATLSETSSKLERALSA